MPTSPVVEPVKLELNFEMDLADRPCIWKGDKHLLSLTAPDLARELGLAANTPVPLLIDKLLDLGVLPEDWTDRK